MARGSEKGPFDPRNNTTTLPVVGIDNLPSAKQHGVLLAVIDNGNFRLALSDGKGWVIFAPPQTDED